MTLSVWERKKSLCAAFWAQLHTGPIITRCHSWGWLPAPSLLFCLKLQLLFLLFSPRYFPLSTFSNSPFFFLSSCLLHFQLFLEHALQERGKSSTNCFSPRGAWQSDPSLLHSLLSLSLAPSFSLSLPLSLSASLPLSLSSPCCDRAHLLDLGCTRSESNYPIRPSQPLHSLIPHDSAGFWESGSSRPLRLFFASLSPRTGRWSFQLFRRKKEKLWMTGIEV